MSAIVLDRAREALNLEERKNPAKLQGDLQGRKVTPFPFYLLLGGAILGGASAIALTIAAIALSTFTLYIAAAACTLLCLTNILAALFIYDLAPEEEINSVINALTAKVKNLFHVTQKLRNEQDKNNIPHIAVPMYENQNLDKEAALLDHQVEDQNKFLTIFKQNLLEFVDKHENDQEVLQKNLEDLIIFVKDRGEDTSHLEKMKDSLKKIDLDELADPKDILEQQYQNSRAIHDLYIEILPVLTKYIEQYEYDLEGAEKEIETLTGLKNEAERQIEEKTLELEEKTKKWNGVKNLVDSSVPDGSFIRA